ARLVGMEAQNRTVTIPLDCQGSSHDDLERLLSALWTMDDEWRRFGGSLTYRPNGGSFKLYYDVLDSSVQIASFGRTFHANNLVTVTLAPVCAPYLRGD